MRHWAQLSGSCTQTSPEPFGGEAVGKLSGSGQRLLRIRKGQDGTKARLIFAVKKRQGVDKRLTANSQLG
jgi:hypothetical protein